jgi:hypothetical protein
MFWRRPYGTLEVICGTRSPHESTSTNQGRFLGTPAQRGANKRCAYGAIAGANHYFCQLRREGLRSPQCHYLLQASEIVFSKTVPMDFDVTQLCELICKFSVEYFSGAGG